MCSKLYRGCKRCHFTSQYQILPTRQGMQEAMRAHQVNLTQLNLAYKELVEQSQEANTKLPDHIQQQMDALNQDWTTIHVMSDQLAQTQLKEAWQQEQESKAVVETITVVTTTQVHAPPPPEPEPTSPWPDFDMSVLQFLDWLKLTEHMVKTQVVVIADVEDIEGHIVKLKVGRWEGNRLSSCAVVVSG